MKFIKSLQNRVTKFVQKRGSVLPKLFVWVYALFFVVCGLLTTIGVIYEFYTHGQVNYKAVNDFVREYFAPSIAGTFVILGVLLIDKDKDGVPDKWEEDIKK